MCITDISHKKIISVKQESPSLAKRLNRIIFIHQNFAPALTKKVLPSAGNAPGPGNPPARRVK
jgi:hypothetical protein